MRIITFILLRHGCINKRWPDKKYALTLDMAKELCMVERIPFHQKNTPAEN
ncbi:antA/AntB antirepressor family protein [Candidatus Tokpelaia sp.]|uniref:antA/AntB antirepressor family protein n=1 Tax=Candidatus Tokpelaia sp. TaxID=2233777 RepID=UPI0012398836|nr:hypothetical protein DPQ22_09230 [Candidatus Tokpelaia sp.]